DHPDGSSWPPARAATESPARSFFQEIEIRSARRRRRLSSVRPIRREFRFPGPPCLSFERIQRLRRNVPSWACLRWSCKKQRKSNAFRLSCCSIPGAIILQQSGDDKEKIRRQPSIDSAFEL